MSRNCKTLTHTGRCFWCYLDVCRAIFPPKNANQGKRSHPWDQR
jgi:hypothetical protein